MGAKSNYYDHLALIAEQLRLNNDMASISSLEKGLERFKKYSANWIEVDLDEVINRLVPNPLIDYTSSEQKIIFYSPNSPYKIVCDKTGSYFRIVKIVTDKYGTHEIYVGIDGKEPKLMVEGKNIPLSSEDFKRLTHFKILLKKEMKK